MDSGDGVGERYDGRDAGQAFRAYSKADGDKAVVPCRRSTNSEEIVGEIAELEQRIGEAMRTMAECPERKRAVLRKWL